MLSNTANTLYVLDGGNKRKLLLKFINRRYDQHFNRKYLNSESVEID